MHTNTSVLAEAFEVATTQPDPKPGNSAGWWNSGLKNEEALRFRV